MFLTEEWRSSHAILCCVVKILLFYHPLSVSMCLLLSVSRSQTWPNKAVRLTPPGSFQSFVWKHYSFFVSNGTTDWVIESKYSKSKDHNQNRIKRYMNCYTPSFWLIKANFQPIRRTGQIWVVTHYQHGISAFIPADLPTPRPCKSGVFERKPPKTSRLGPQTWSSPNNVSNKTQKMKIIFVIVFFALLDMIYSTHF